VGHKAVAAILQNVKECNTTMAENNYDWNTVPEKFEEIRKQNAGYWSGDAMPTINIWHFYHEDDDGKWCLKVVPENTTSGATPETDDTFICQSEGPVADTWRNIIHVQFADLNNKAPLLYHSVRSLGLHFTNPVTGRITPLPPVQHTLDQFNILLRIQTQLTVRGRKSRCFRILESSNPECPSFPPPNVIRLTRNSLKA